MPKRSVADRRLYLRAAADFWRQTIELQRKRCHSDDPDGIRQRADLDFFVVAVKRLRAAAEQARDRLPGDRQPMRDAVERFNEAWPRLDEVRDVAEHVSGPGTAAPLGNWYMRLDIFEGHPDGRPETLVHVEDMQPAIDDLYASICAYLSDAPA